MSTDDTLLRREAELLWGTDDCGRTEPGPFRVVRVPADGPPDPPAELREAAEGPGLELRGCRSFVLGPTPDERGAADLVGSEDGPDRLALLIAPGPDEGQPGWSSDEWGALTSGRWGPWVAATEPAPGGRLAVTALCHSPRLRAGAAEAGVWTRPDRRRRGLAARVTAAWSGLAGRNCDLLLYSARPDNQASLAVAARLGARPIGSLWQLWRVG